jgi:hypothetical protein
MWERTKRLINSYIDELIERLSRPDAEVVEIITSEKARLNELEAQARASAKMLEKELAEVELKCIGASERERLARERGDIAAASSAACELSELEVRRDLLRKQIAEAEASAERARAIRNEHSRVGPELVTESLLASMRETLAGVQTPFSPTDPAATIEEMRARIKQTHTASQEDNTPSRSWVDEILGQYKKSLSESNTQALQTTSQQGGDDATDPEQPKTLGPTRGPICPID